MTEAGLRAAPMLCNSHSGLQRLIRCHYAARRLLKPTIRFKQSARRIRTLMCAGCSVLCSRHAPDCKLWPSYGTRQGYGRLSKPRLMWSNSRKWPTKPRATQAMRIGQRELVWQKVVSELARANSRVLTLKYTSPFVNVLLMTMPTRRLHLEHIPKAGGALAEESARAVPPQPVLHAGSSQTS